MGQRTEQSNYLAAIVDALPEQRIDAGGDFNTFPRPDDPLNRTTTPHQLAALYDAAGMTNLYDVLVDEVPASAYSYVFVGMAQTLDGQFVSDTLADELGQARIAHVNADWPADTPGDGGAVRATTTRSSPASTATSPSTGWSPCSTTSTRTARSRATTPTTS